MIDASDNITSDPPRDSLAASDTPAPAPAPIASASPRRGARPAVLIAVGTAFYMLTLGLALYELDRQHYTERKAEIIRNSFREIFALPENLEELARPALDATTPAVREVAADRMREKLEEVVAGPTSMYSMEVRDKAGVPLMKVTNLDKPALMNTWDNNLFIRSFDRATDLLIKGSGRIVGHYASPPDNAAIRALTVHYRFIAAGIAALWLVVYFFLYKYLLRPLQRITHYLERSRLQSPELIPAPSGWLERSYNDIAGQALLQALQSRLDELPRTADADARSALFSQALSRAAEDFGLVQFVVAELTLAGSDDEAPDDAHAFLVAETISAGAAAATRTPQEMSAAATRLLVACRPAAQVAQAGHEDVPSSNAHRNGFVTTPDGRFEYIDQSAGQTLMAWGQLAHATLDTAFRLTLARRACDAVRAAFLGLRAYRQDMFRQRSEANITLARNLGHDLTNIIATGRLDLLAVRQILAGPGEGGQVDSAHAELLQQSVQGLLETMRFLQEIVNIYRSFSYVKRPAYERHDLNELVSKFITVFEPTVSKRLEIRRDLQADLPSLILELRLLKLALFNVMTNALDAFKRMNDADIQPRLTVSTRLDVAAQTYLIQITDNGPGIRDAAGELLDRARIDSIFQYGISTKVDQSEGLGLNWVRTIVHDFHAGRVSAENLPEGGARITLLIRSMEASEARITNKRI